MPTLEAGSALDVAIAVSERLPESTSQTARELYEALVWCSVETARRKGQSPAITEALLHLPLEQLAAACQISRVTAWRHLPQLKALGLVDWRTHKGSLRGETRSTGTCWAVRLSPYKGPRARLSADDLRHKWRDLDADVRAGRTSYRALKHTKALEDKLLKFEMLLAWTLPPSTLITPVTPVCFNSRSAELEAVLDVASAPKAQRGPAVDAAAQALARALRDQASVNFFRRLTWQLLRRFDSTGEDHSYSVYLAAIRARTDAAEGFARRPGALMQSRLKGASWFAEMMAAPPTRVGSRPAAQA